MKKATIIVTLVEECKDVANCDIEGEIEKELSENLSVIPWAREIKSVTVE